MCGGMGTTLLENDGEESVLEEVVVLLTRHCLISPNNVLEFAHGSSENVRKVVSCTVGVVENQACQEGLDGEVCAELTVLIVGEGSSGIGKHCPMAR